MASLGDWPATIIPASCMPRLMVNQRAAIAPNDSSEQVVDMLNDRWVFELTLPVENYADAAAVEAFLNSFRGQFNTVNAWHFARPEIRGTLAGTLTTSGSQAQGASSLVVTGGTNGQTVKAGDVFGAGGQLLMASADATVAAGVVTIPLVNRLRAAIATGQAVTTSKPKAVFRKLSDSGIMFRNGLTDEISLTLGEVPQ